MQYSTYITYNPNWHFYAKEKRERRTTYNAFSKELIKHQTKIIQVKDVLKAEAFSHKKFFLDDSQ